MNFHLCATVFARFGDAAFGIRVIGLGVLTKANLVASAGAIDAAPILFFPAMRFKGLAANFALLGYFHDGTPNKMRPVSQTVIVV